MLKRARFSHLPLLLLLTFVFISHLAQAQDRAKNNGDIYVVSEKKFMAVKSTNMPLIVPTSIAMLAGSTTPRTVENEYAAAMSYCNASFSIPMDYIVEFNATGELPNVIDKTAMCFIRCFFEKSGLIENWKLNTEKIRQSMWPATGDSIDYCQQQARLEVNACVRTYAIAKCLMIRAIVDARNKPVV